MLQYHNQWFLNIRYPPYSTMMMTATISMVIIVWQANWSYNMEHPILSRQGHHLSYTPAVLLLCGGGTPWATVVQAPHDTWIWDSRKNDNWQGTPKNLERTYPTAILSITNPTRPDVRSSSSYCTAYRTKIVCCKYIWFSDWYMYTGNTVCPRTSPHVLNISVEKIHGS
jgi:hypothetical protein